MMDNGYKDPLFYLRINGDNSEDRKPFLKILFLSSFFNSRSQPFAG